jgi:trehalose 6-phosphate synthase
MYQGGDIAIRHPASGLVTAMEPIMRACSGTWIAHGSGTADKTTADAHGRIAVPPNAPAYTLRRVWLSEQEERGYYYGFANEGLWPLCHYAHHRPTFRTEDYDQYRAVNQQFVDAVCEEVSNTGDTDPIILVQDYHFALAPRMLRDQLPGATIVAFWHVPWPHAERMGICPWRSELVDGLLGASIIGFHTQLHCNNFIETVDAFMEARIDREENAVVRRGRQSLIRPYPISVEWPQHWTLGAPAPLDTAIGWNFIAMLPALGQMCRPAPSCPAWRRQPVACIARGKPTTLLSSGSHHPPLREDDNDGLQEDV